MLFPVVFGTFEIPGHNFSSESRSKTAGQINSYDQAQRKSQNYARSASCELLREFHHIPASKIGFP